MKTESRYKIYVGLSKPKSREVIAKQKLIAEFYRNDDDEGNGYRLGIIGDELYEQEIDLRFEKNFSEEKEISRLTKWCCEHFNGKKGAYKLRDITIKSSTYRKYQKNMPVRVMRKETYETFSSIHEAARLTDISPASIYACIYGKARTAGGYHWISLGPQKEWIPRGKAHKNIEREEEDY